jgi:hypothetical protein
MRTHVEFLTDKFPTYPGEEEKINPGRWGQRLAEFLQRHLQARGILVAGEIGFEDWGCEIKLEQTPFPMWIGCGNYEEYPDGFLCFIEPSKPLIRRFLFKKIDTRPEVTRIADALDAILISDPEIRDVKWWSEQET